MRYSIKNAGAQKGCLILENEKNNKLCIEAESELDYDITILESVPVEESTNLSSTVVHYVKRTGESVVLSNAHKEGSFINDLYVKKNKIKSLLCSPIAHKGKMTGIIYLENNLSTNTFTDERLELLRILSSQAAISIENARLLTHRENSAKLEREMEIAANIQTGLLPQNPSIDGYDVSAYMKPADNVGGDYYDIINSGGRNWIIIGDVSGHGVPAGLIMIMVQTCIRHTLNIYSELSPSKLLSMVNKTITENIEMMGESKYLTITVLETHDNKRFTFAGLHQDIMIYRNKTGVVETLRTDGFLLGLGVNVGKKMKDYTFELGIGDIILIYTDGITEAWKKGSLPDKRNMTSDMFGNARLMKIFSNSCQGSSEEIKNSILMEIEDYECNDDVTMVVLKKVK